MTDSNRNSSLIRGGDAVRRSMTHNSHYSHASTHSWVISTQQNPPPPPEESEIPPSPSPMRTPRPLPDPQLQPQHHTQPLRTVNADPADDEEEYMNIDANVPGMELGYRTEGLGRGRSPRLTPASPGFTRDAGPAGNRPFVGGFVNGLRRLPKVVLKYATFGDKRKYIRRGTLGSGGTETSATGMTTGNTLPLYTSNPATPVAGPSNTQYVQAMEMPVPLAAQEPPPVILGPSLSQRRRNPSFRVTPPSEEIAEEGNVRASLHTQLTVPSNTPQFTEGVVESPRDGNTVTIYHLPGQEEFPVDEQPLPLPAPTPNRWSDSHHQQPPQDAIPVETAPQSPVLAHPAPTPDYRKMTLSSSPLSPDTMATSLTSEPSFSSELNPVKRFFLGLYHLPWIAPDRVTVDYRPHGHHSGHRGGSGVKKPMSTWYRGTPGVVLTVKSGSGEVDLLSSGAPSPRASAGTSTTPLATPLAARGRHHSDQPRHRHRHREHRRRTEDDDTHRRRRESHHHRHRDTTSTTDMYQQHGASPIIPAVYPFPYPYPYPYQTLPPPPAPRRAHSQSAPRGPRPHRTQTYPHGYAPYQPPPPALPPPMYVISSPAQTNSSGEAGQTTAQVLSPVYMPVQVVPGAYNQEQVPVGSPPAQGGQTQAAGA